MQVKTSWGRRKTILRDHHSFPAFLVATGLQDAFSLVVSLPYALQKVSDGTRSLVASETRPLCLLALAK